VRFSGERAGTIIIPVRDRTITVMARAMIVMAGAMIVMAGLDPAILFVRRPTKSADRSKRMAGSSPAVT